MTNKIIAARFSIKDAKLIEDIVKARGEDKSSFIRRAVRTELAKLNYFSEVEKKALGVSNV